MTNYWIRVVAILLVFGTLVFRAFYLDGKAETVADMKPSDLIELLILVAIFVAIATGD